MRNKYYIFHTSCDYVDAVCSLIKFVGGSVYTIITNREIPEGSINHYRVYCRLSWSQMMRLKRRLKGGTGSSRTTYRQASERSNQISGMTFDDILGKETEKLCQLEK